MFVELFLCLITYCYILQCKGLQFSKYKNNFLNNLHIKNVIHHKEVSHLKKRKYTHNGTLHISDKRRGQTLLSRRRKCTWEYGLSKCDQQGEANHQGDDKVDYEVGDEMDDKVDDEMDDKIDDEVDVQVDDEMDVQVDDEVDDEVDVQVDDEMDVETDVETDVQMDDETEEYPAAEREMYEKLFNVEGDEEDRMLSPKYNMNMYNVLEKNYEEKEDNKVILTIKSLQYEINNKKLISNLNLQLHKSECVGLIGNNGCGKTTLLNLIYEHSNNSNKSIILNNKVSTEKVQNFTLNEENLNSMVKKNKFDHLYKILSYMRRNSFDLSAFPFVIKNKKVSDFEQMKKKMGTNTNLFYKNDVFYFKQNIHLLENNNLTVFEKVLKFYEPILDKYEVLCYIESNISKYKKFDTLKMFDIEEAEEKSNYPPSELTNKQYRKRVNRNGKMNNNGCSSGTSLSTLTKEEDSNCPGIMAQFGCISTDSNGNTRKKEKKNEDDVRGRQIGVTETVTQGEDDQAEESFAQSKYFELIIQLYMNEKENVFKELNQVKMNFHKYINILNLKNFLHVKLRDMSNGYIIRVYLLLLLLSKSKLLLIDEINNNLDIFNIFFIMNIFNYSLKYKEIGIILASHDFFLVSKLCNRILDFNKIYGHDIDFSNIAQLKKMNRNINSINHFDDVQELQRRNENGSNTTFFKGNYTEYLHNMKILFDHRRKKKEELKRIIDQLSTTINQAKKKKNKEFMHQSLKKKEEDYKLYQNIYSLFFDNQLNYQYMYYNLIYSKKNEKNSNKFAVENFNTKESAHQQFSSREGNTTKGDIQTNKGNGKNVKYHITHSDSNCSDGHLGRTGTSFDGSIGKNVDNYLDKYCNNDMGNNSPMQLEHEEEEDVKTFVYNKIKDVEGSMNKNVLIDMSKKIKNNELIEIGEKYGKNNVSLYEFENFSFYFLNKKKKKKYIFKNMNLSINSGENVLLLGKNGIGKSTLFKILTNKYNFQMRKEGGRHQRSIYAYGDGEEIMDEEEESDQMLNRENIGTRVCKEKVANFEGNINCNFNNVLLTYFEQNMIKKLNLEINDYFRYLIEKVNYEPIHFDDSLEIDNDSIMNSYNYNNRDDYSNEEHFLFYVLNKTKPFCNEQDVENIEEKIKALLKIFYIDSSTRLKEKSGGEKVRILLLSLFLKKSNLLLLDEINNNLDIYLKNLLLNFLNFIYQGRYILTTHDFYIIKNLNNLHKIIYIFDYENVFTFYNVQDFIQNFYHFILNSFNSFHMFNGHANKTRREFNQSIVQNNILHDRMKHQISPDLVQEQNQGQTHGQKQKNGYYHNMNTAKSSQHDNDKNNVVQKNEKIDASFFYERNNNGQASVNPVEVEKKKNLENYDKILYDNHDYEILQFLKTQYDKDRNERKNYEQINDNMQEDEIFESKKVNKKNFGGKGSSGKIKIKNWKRWKK
ncbi:ABC transporter [Plasmodium gonderi]|uniref:ABC transporter n=1 Tax=Plasmodium gonderi TaxID=77519 RepID=A0A1Y1JLX0_PLAGO|nr:ABC transporter [Plasmodium gonderi]GAW83461.1 ABC transporter [Plasmodium gonderi]